MGAALKIIIIAVLVVLSVWLLGQVSGTYGGAGSSGQMSIEQLDMHPETPGSVAGDWRQTDVMRVLVPMLFSGPSPLGYEWPSPMTVVWTTMLSMITIAGLVIVLRILFKVITAG